MILNLYLFRHAETENNVNKDRVAGQSNSLELSQRGLEQAKLLGIRLKKEKIFFNQVYSSTAVRAKKTSEIVCETIDFPKNKIITSNDLLEISQGDWEGKKRIEVYTPEIIARIKKETWNFKAPNGESQKEVEERAYNWIKKNLLKELNKNLSVAIFGHGLTTKCLIRKIMNSDPRLTYKISIDNCSITQFKYCSEGQHQGWSLIKVNDNSHLQNNFVSDDRI